MKKFIHYAAVESMRRRFTATLFTMVLLAIFPFSKSFSNNLLITNVSYSQGSGTVTFDLSWDNSWRKSDWTAKNWDAAWVFVKWRNCDSAATIPFEHGLISTNVSDHTFSGSTILEPTMEDGSAGIDASPNNTGAMLRRASDLTTGTVSAHVILKLDNLPATGTLDFRVFGIEMVFVPQNSYILGDGNGTAASTYSFTSIANTGSPNLYASAIASENPQTVNEYSTNYCPIGTCALTAEFQKGYNAFYMMKYEISQGQFADFLNATNSSSQIVHFYSSTANRYSIVNTGTPPTQYSADRPDRACNWLSWADVSTFLDWAALRPLTELEYEKASRGTEPAIAYQKAWGSNSGTRATTINCPSCTPLEDGTETISAPSGANVNTGNATTWSGGDGSTGPLRSGIFATSGTSTRLATGMGFYGAMELSGNVAEYYISAIAGVTPNISSTGVELGDGNIVAATGYHNVSTWPIADPALGSSGTNIIRRGGSWNSSTGASAGDYETNISYRNGGTTNSRDANGGGRGGR